jgi:hypothetical protein
MVFSMADISVYKTLHYVSLCLVYNFKWSIVQLQLFDLYELNYRWVLRRHSLPSWYYCFGHILQCTWVDVVILICYYSLCIIFCPSILDCNWTPIFLIRKETILVFDVSLLVLMIKYYALSFNYIFC